MWFSHAYSAAPLCAPSRAALLTGVHPNRSGIYYNSHAYRRAPNFIAGVTNLPGLFLRNGYLTAGHGKIGHNSYVRDELPDFSPGYFKTLDNTKDRDISYTNTDLLDHLMPGTRTSIPGQASRSWDWGILPDDWDRDDPKKMQQDTEHSRKGIAGRGHAKNPDKMRLKSECSMWPRAEKGAGVNRRGRWRPPAERCDGGCPDRSRSNRRREFHS